MSIFSPWTDIARHEAQSTAGFAGHPDSVCNGKIRRMILVIRHVLGTEAIAVCHHSTFAKSLKVSKISCRPTRHPLSLLLRP
jgi:hypothetical protein